MTVLRSVMLMAAVLLLALPALATAAGIHPVEDIEAGFDLLAAGRANEAAAAFQRLFTDWEGHPDVIHDLDRIEEGLTRAKYLAGAKPLTAKDLFGDHVTSFDTETLEVELTFRGGPGGSWWTASSRTGYVVLDVEFRGALIVTYTLQSGHDPHVLLFWDDERWTGYEARPVYNVIVVRDGQETTSIHRGEPGPEGTEQGAFVNGDEVGITHGRYLLGKTRHTGIREGRAALGKGTFSNVQVHGFLSPAWIQDRIEKTRDWKIREWAKDHFSRDREIPEWARKAAASAGSPLGPPPDREEILLLHELALAGNETAVRALRRRRDRTDLLPPAALRLSAVLALSESRNAEALAHATALVAAEPDQSDAHALLGVALCRLRKKAPAAAAIDRALELSPTDSLAWYGRVQLGLLDYDLEATLETLNAAIKAGAASPWLVLARTELGRAVAGPGWKDHETVTTRHFEIRSPESRELCRKVAHTLESALRDYSKFFPAGAETKKRARVYVFRDRNEYLAWSRASGRHLENSVGVYVHLFRELAFFRGNQSESSFLQVVRHEGLHRFVGLFLDETPIWMNEGCAEYFCHCREKFGGGIDPGEIDREAVRLLQSRRRSLTPLRELFVMDPATFMADAEVHYAQAWAVIHYLFEGDARRLRSVFRSYFAALTEGRTAEEAFREHLEPVLGKIEANYLDFRDR